MAISGNLANDYGYSNSGSAIIGQQRVNNPPIVKIEMPAEGTELKLNSSVRYLVSISDQEDGSTKYGEIPPNEVILELTYWSSMSAANAYKSRVSDTTEEPAGLALIKKSGCFNCHMDKTRLVGPSFEDLANRYAAEPTIIETLTKKIINGSIGAWGEERMPANPGLSQTEVSEAVNFILKQGGNKYSRIYTGYEGAIRPFEHVSENTTSVYVLTSFYTDKGIDGVPGSGLKGQDAILLN